MAMKLLFEHVFEDGIHKVKLVSFSGIMKKVELPYEYLNSSDSAKCYINILYGKEVLYVYPEENGGLRSYSEGDIISLESKEWLIETLKSAGSSLCKINNKIREEKKRWEGVMQEYII